MPADTVYLTQFVLLSNSDPYFLLLTYLRISARYLCAELNWFLLCYLESTMASIGFVGDPFFRCFSDNSPVILLVCIIVCVDGCTKSVTMSEACGISGVSAFPHLPINEPRIKHASWRYFV